MFSIKRPMVLLVGWLFSSVAFGANVTCSGKVTTIAYHTGAGGGFMLQLDSMNVPVFICSVDDVWTKPGASHSTQPDSCQTMISVFMTAKATDQPLDQVVFDGDDVPATCDGWESWKYANVMYFQFK